MSRRGQMLLIALVLPVWCVGLLYSLKERSRQFRPAPQHKWFARYEALGPALEGIDRVAMVHNAPNVGMAKSQLFKAQYVLAPKILRLRNKKPLLETDRVRKIPLIYDFRKPKELQRVLAETAAQAEQRGMRMTTHRVGWALAVVHFHKD
ncbi:MAG: hypothetical protein AAF560_08685 [Acidobacteriota bacterium]